MPSIRWSTMEAFIRPFLFCQLVVASCSLQQRKGLVLSVAENAKFECEPSTKQTFHASSRLQCTGRCLKEQGCRLLNFAAEGSEHGEHNCEIFSESSVSRNCQEVDSRRSWLAIKLQRMESEEEKVSADQGFSSCRDIYERAGTGYAQDGILELRPGRHYCAMKELGECKGRGWTLAISVNGSMETFRSDSDYWTNTHVYDVDDGLKNPFSIEAKYPAFAEINASELCIGLNYDGIQSWLHIPALNSSLYDIFRHGNYLQTGLGPGKWINAIRNASLQGNCKNEGVNAHIDTGEVYARIGILQGEHGKDNGCRSSCSYIGIGIKWNKHSGTGRHVNGVSCGNLMICGPVKDRIAAAAFGMIFVR